ncbi:hypothetical protein IWZ01DRAFT_480618 [Phyllosticta capitalensis]
MPSKRANRRRAAKNRETKDQDNKSDQAVGHQATESHVTESYAPNQGLIGRLPVDLQLKIYHSLDYPSAIFLAATSRFYRSVVDPSTLIPEDEKIRFIQQKTSRSTHRLWACHVLDAFASGSSRNSITKMSRENWRNTTREKRDESHDATASNAVRSGKRTRTMLGWRLCQRIGRRWSTLWQPFGDAPLVQTWAADLRIMDALNVAFVCGFTRAAH